MKERNIRDATPDDHAAFQRLFAELGVDDPPATFETFVQSFMPTMILAERDGEVLAYAYFRMLDGGAHLGQIATSSAARRQGIGRALMAEVAKRIKALGGTWWQLNVKPDNVAARALYEAFGMKTEHRAWALWMAWADVLKQPAPHLADVRVLEPSEDLAWEQRLATPPGLVAMARKLPTRHFRVVSDDALMGFDVDFPGAFPFLVRDTAKAFSLLHAARSFAKPEKDPINVNLEHEATKDAFIAAGARLRFEMLRMRGPL